MPSLSARALRRRPDLAAGRAWRATMPGGSTTPSGHGSAILLVLVAFSLLYMVVGRPEMVSWSVFLPLVVLSGVIHRPGEHAFVVSVSLGCLAAAALLVGEDIPHAVGTLLAGALINNPWTIVPILGMTYWSGALLIGRTDTPAFDWHDLSFTGLYQQMLPYAAPFALGGIVLGGIIAVIAVVIMVPIMLGHGI